MLQCISCSFTPHLSNQSYSFRLPFYSSQHHPNSHSSSVTSHSSSATSHSFIIISQPCSFISCYSPCRTNSQADRTRLLILIGKYTSLTAPGSHFTVYSSQASSHSSYLALDGLQNNSRVQATANVLDLSRSKTLFHSSQHLPNSFIVPKSHPTVFYSHITQFQGPTSKFLCHSILFSLYCSRITQLHSLIPQLPSSYLQLQGPS